MSWGPVPSSGDASLAPRSIMFRSKRSSSLIIAVLILNWNHIRINCRAVNPDRQNFIFFTIGLSGVISRASSGICRNKHLDNDL